MCGRRSEWAFVSPLIPLLVAALLGGCALRLGHREGYVDFGLRDLDFLADSTWVLSPQKDSLAGRIGLKYAQEIVSINGKAVRSEADLETISESLALGDKVEITIKQHGSGRPTTTTFQGTVTQADIGRSSNYLIYGYEKAGKRTKRRWLHLGVIAFGDWTGKRTTQGYRSRGGIHVDVPPERMVST